MCEINNIRLEVLQRNERKSSFESTKSTILITNILNEKAIVLELQVENTVTEKNQTISVQKWQHLQIVPSKR